VNGRAIGESWEFSTLPGRESRANGEPLPAVLGRPLGFLAKLIDTRLPLSIQVHPAADRASGWGGKEEAWIVLEADPGAEVLAGLAPGVGARDLAAGAREALESGRPDALVSKLRRIPVQSGTVVLVPSGTLHSIGAHVLLAEIQQPADRTLRLYDWDSGRPLQVEQALSAAAPAAVAQVWQPWEAPRSLRGAHVELSLLGPGTHVIDVAGEALVVPVRGCCALQAGEVHTRAASGELRLCTARRLSVEVEPSGLAVVGSVASG
jgi:mannose-6-phosphate isomerase